MPSCPQCDGSAQEVTIYKDGYIESFTCSICEGKGKVPKERLVRFMRGQSIRREREEYNLSLKDLSLRWGISISYLRRLEAGEIQES